MKMRLTTTTQSLVIVPSQGTWVIEVLVLLMIMIMSWFDLDLENTLLQAHSVPSLKSVAMSASSPAFNCGWLVNTYTFHKSSLPGQVASQYNNFPLLYLKFCLLVGFCWTWNVSHGGGQPWNPGTWSLRAVNLKSVSLIVYHVESNFLPCWI